MSYWWSNDLLPPPVSTHGESAGEKTAEKDRAAPLAAAAHSRSVLQRKCSCGQHTVAGGKCHECKNDSEQGRRGVSGTPLAAQDIASSPGQPLDDATRAYMEPLFRRDFSRVRVHHDVAAAQAARAVHAQAYATGNHLVFDSGRYAPSTQSGKWLIAHELAHAVQQQIGPGGDKRAAEKEADRAAEGIRSGEPVKVVARAADDLQRQPNPSAGQDTEREKIIEVTRRTQGDLKSRARDLVSRMLTRYFPEYVDKVSTIAYEEKEPSIRTDVKDTNVGGKKVQSATVTVGKAFIDSATEDALRERITELRLSLEASGLTPKPDPTAPSGYLPERVYGIINAKFPKKGRRVHGAVYDAKLPGLLTEFKSVSVQVGGNKVSWSGPRIYFGKAFASLPEADREPLVLAELDKIDKWSVENALLVKEDLEDPDITFRIRGLSGAALIALRDKVADPVVKDYVDSLLTTSTPIEEGLAKTPSGLAVTIGPVTVIVAPDRTGRIQGQAFKAETPSDTTVTPSQIPAFHWDRNNIIDRFPGYSPTVTIRAQTTFRPGVSKDITQGYGKGTTARERELGATSLRYHEGSHGLDIVRFVKANPYPVFGGKIGDTLADFRQSVRDYIQARRDFNKGLQDFTDVQDECPGTSIDDFMRNKDPNWKSLCP